MRICVSILPKNASEALELISKAEEVDADLIEVRLDLLNDKKNLSELVKSTKIPLIATNKLLSEKGFFSGTELERQQTLIGAAKTGFKYVDINLSSAKLDETIKELKSLNVKPIISYHNFDGVLKVSSMEKILDEQIRSGAYSCKIILTAKQIEDNLPILSFVAFASAKTKLVCFCMGEQGKLSRLLSPVFGGFFTFASLKEGSETANGQMTINEMKTMYKLLGVRK